MFFKKMLTASVGVAIALTPVSLFSPLAFAENFQEIYVFGDSLSDMGNMFQSTQGDSPSSPPYYQGRYSNGRVWVEYLGSQLKLNPNPNTNFAYGGATTGDSPQVPLGLLTQINDFKTKNPVANPQALYIIWAGANDYLGGGTNPTVPVNNLDSAVTTLARLGAKKIAVLNLPDLGKLPGTRNTESAASLNNLTQKHNSQLASSLKDLRQKLSPEREIIYIDVNTLFNQVITQPQKFGLKNVTQACLNQGKVCDRPNEYLFWDGIHPTTAGHKLLKNLALSAIASQPTPASQSVPKSNQSELIIPLSVILLSSLSAGFILVRQQQIHRR